MEVCDRKQRMKKDGIKFNSMKIRTMITVVFVAIAVAATGYSYHLMQRRVPDMHLIFLLVAGISVVMLIALVIWTLSASNKFLSLAKMLRRCYLIFIALGIGAFIILQILIISSAHTEEADVDVLIVLGAGLRNNEPSLILRGRLDAAIMYMEHRAGVPVIVSGGLGQGVAITEAEAMFHYLRARGIDESLIWKEGLSTNTYENLMFSRTIMEENGIDVDNAKVAVVSNEFHLFRARMIARNAGFEAVGVAAETPSLSLRVLYSFREAFALANEILF
ncbi:MAG: YdcF family protein [Oscillospiraceae bacterium]|nr:YdcF family protein [Oscillospiraceae bacterium]